MPQRDRPFDLCSHKRSGTHFLAATLLLNFEMPDQELRPCIGAGLMFRNGEQVWKPGQRAVIPWGGLWSSHGFLNPRWRDTSRVLYIVRNPVDTLLSYWRLMGPITNLPPERFVDRGRAAFWYRHAKGYTNHCCWVRYEDLVGDGHDQALDRIAQRFGLTPRQGGYKRLPERVGWYPYPMTTQPATPPAELIDSIRAEVPAGFLGYDV